MDKLKEMNAECFIYENYEPNWWSALDLSFEEALEYRNIRRKIKKYAVGYCESSRIRLRPKEDSYSIMIEKDGERFWFHVPKDTFKEGEEND